MRNIRCKGRNQYDEPCGHTASPGTDYCWRHTSGYKSPLQKLKEENAKLKHDKAILQQALERIISGVQTTVQDALAAIEKEQK